ncbi:hypothetical protein [cyanobacterium endosymbiont of Rhopalodia gibberula]|uniref:hypothetical protein n=1 Tax=cyanobacterium endosymbiont of Rhopalodia gibberula TaxID=1763363 RepID=UPI000E65D234|nr:hypothetical protein [cyanobacterium endosymbiont of Rhopalodia gibberula]
MRIREFLTSQNVLLGLMSMFAELGNPSTISEVFRGNKGDRNEPQLIDAQKVIYTIFSPLLKESFVKVARDSGF